MEVTYCVKEHINLGRYEWAEIGITVTAEAGPKPDIEEWAEQLQQSADDLLAPARERYRELTDERSSFIHDHPALQETD